MTSPPSAKNLRPFRSFYGSRSAFAHATKPPLTRRYLPVLQTLRDYDAQRSRADFAAGITVAALALPSAMAYAQLAGIGVSAGLYALLLPVVAYAVLGSYRRLVVGPESTVSILVAISIAPLAHGDAVRYAALVSALALMIGGIYLAAWAIRLGWIADYFSQAVLVGYISGVAVVLIVGQAGKLFGIALDPSGTFAKAADLLTSLDESHALTLAIGGVTLVSLIVLGRFASRVPGALIVVCLGIGLSWLFGFGDRGVAVTGPVPGGLPHFSIPDVGTEDLLSLVGPALAIFLVGFADSILTARSFAMRHREPVKPDQELLAQGAANLAAGFTQAIPVSTSGSRTAVNDGMATSQVSGMVAAATIAVILLVLTEPIQYLPSAVLGAIIIYAAAKLIKPQAWRALRRSSIAEVVIAAVTMLFVIGIGVLQALVIAVVLSLLDVIRRSARPHDAVLGYSPTNQRWSDVGHTTDTEVSPGIVVYRLGERMFFANAHYVKRRMWAAVHGAPPPVRWFIFDAGATGDIDASAQSALQEVVEGLRAEGVGFAVARARNALLQNLGDVGLADLIGPENFYPTVMLAVAACEGQPPISRPDHDSSVDQSGK